jgi:hypothetical protein
MLRSTMKRCRCLEMVFRRQKGFPRIYLMMNQRRIAWKETRKIVPSEWETIGKRNQKAWVRYSLLLRSRLWQRGISRKNRITIQRIVTEVSVGCAISHYHLHTTTADSTGRALQFDQSYFLLKLPFRPKAAVLVATRKPAKHHCHFRNSLEDLDWTFW